MNDALRGSEDRATYRVVHYIQIAHTGLVFKWEGAFDMQINMYER